MLINYSSVVQSLLSIRLKNPQFLDKFSNYPFGRRGPRGYSRGLFAGLRRAQSSCELTFIKFVPVLQMVRLAVMPPTKLGQLASIGTVQPAKDEHYIHFLAQIHCRLLPFYGLFAERIYRFEPRKTTITNSG